MVVKTYKPEMKDEVTLQIGSVVEVVEKSMDGWWLVRCKGKEGRAPATNLRRANTAKAQHILEISSQATLEAQVKKELSQVHSRLRCFSLEIFCFLAWYCVTFCDYNRISR